MIITGDDTTGISELQNYLHQQFEMKDLGPLGYFLGLEVSSNFDGYFLSQAKYVSDLLSRAGITNCKTTPTPLEPNVRLIQLDDTPLDDPNFILLILVLLLFLLMHWFLLVICRPLQKSSSEAR